MKFHSLLAVSLAVSLIMLATNSLDAAPVVQFEKATYDFGKMTSGQKGKATFSFKNSGDKPLEVTKVFAICECLKFKNTGTLKVAPGKSQKIEIAFDSAGLQGEVVKRVLFKTNDPAQPKTLLTVRADVKAIADMSPRSVNFGSLKPNEKYETSITLTPLTPKPFKILKTGKGNNSRIASIKPIKDGKNSYKLNLIVNAGKVEKRVMDELTIITDLPGRPSIVLLVFGNVKKEG